MHVSLQCVAFSVLVSIEQTACEASTQSSGSILSCFVCDSVESWDDCDNNGKTSACAANYNRCSNIYNKREEKESYSRGCSNTDTCLLLQEACNRLGKGKNKQCEVTCCQDDKCNAPIPPQYCYVCRSRASWKDCNLDREEVRCSPEQDTCAKVYAEANTNSPYTKMCMTKSECTNLKGNCGKANKREVSGAECDVNCCHGNRCNTASRYLVSGILLLLACSITLF